MAQLPAGFVLDNQPQAQNAPVLPQGFVLDTIDPAASDMRNQQLAASRGAVSGLPIVGPAIASGVEHLAAGLRAPFTDKTYDQELAGIQNRAQQSAAANPGLTKIGNAVGGVVGTLPAVIAAPALFGAGGAALPIRMGVSGLTGGTIAAADTGVRTGGDPEEMLKSAGIGGGLGLIAPGIGALAGKGIGALASKFRGPSGSQTDFARAALADGVTNVRERLAQMGPDAMPMDLGPNLQRQAGALAATPGEAQQTVRSTIATRQAGSGARISESLDNALGQPVDTVAIADDIIAQRSAASKPLYEAAYSKPVPFTKNLEETLTRPAVASALKDAERMAANEGIPSQNWFANIADDGTVSIKNTPDVRQLDLTKRALDDKISSAMRSGNKNEARILTQVRDKLVSEVDSAVPEYAAARKAFSGPSGVLDSLEQGKAVFSKTMTPNELRTMMLKMGDSEKEAFIQGGRAAVADIMGTARSDANAAKNLFANGYNKEKLELLVGKEQAQKMLGSIDAEAAFTRTRDVVTGNSETAAREAAKKEVAGAEPKPGILRSLLNFKFGDALADVGDKAMTGARGAAQAAKNEELAKILTSAQGDGRLATQAIKSVQSAQRRGDIGADAANKLIQSLRTEGTKQTQLRLKASGGSR